MNIYSQLRKVKRSNMLGLRKYINLLYYDPATVQLTYKNVDFVEVDGCRYRVTDQVDSLMRISGNEWFANVRPTDIAVDIGANIGAVTVPVARQAWRVWAYEPLFGKELQENIDLNGLKNVNVLNVGLGKDNGTANIEFSSKAGECQLWPFSKIKSVATHNNHGIDWLKIDCEGYEWCIKPEEFAGIREVRAELHIRRKYNKRDRKCANDWINWFKANGYAVKVDYGIKPTMSVPFNDCMLLWASKIEN